MIVINYNNNVVIVLIRLLLFLRTKYYESLIKL